MTGDSRPLRILYYNWVDYLDPESRGGGVTVYQRNLMSQFAARDDVEVACLSAGLIHDLPKGAPRWEAMRLGPRRDRDRRYALVNSGTLAPGHHSFGHPEQLSHPPTEAAFCDMVARTGPWDVIHFQNLEGIPVGVLAALKARFAGLRIVVSLHNYYPICPQVNLWQRETAHCDDYLDGRACVGCLLHQPAAHLVTAAHGLSYRLQRLGMTPGSWMFDRVFGTAIRVGHRGSRAVGRLRRLGAKRPETGMVAAAAETGPASAHGPRRAETFVQRRETMIAALNDHADVVLGVSDRVCDVAASYGIARDRLRTSYIGTVEAARFAKTDPRGPLPGRDGVLHLAYLGYMRRDKGFFFLLDALETLPEHIARRIHLTVAARRGDGAAMVRLDALGDRLGAVRHHDGYSHDNLDDILETVDVGLVPVLWEDNLPQVAIEMHSRRIPLLTSDRGGAQELSGHGAMVFASGEIASFQARLEAILAGEIDMESYWADAQAPQGMEGHLAELLEVYARPA